MCQYSGDRYAVGEKALHHGKHFFADKPAFINQEQGKKHGNW